MIIVRWIGGGGMAYQNWELKCNKTRLDNNSAAEQKSRKCQKKLLWKSSKQCKWAHEVKKELEAFEQNGIVHWICKCVIRPTKSESAEMEWKECSTNFKQQGLIYEFFKWPPVFPCLVNSFYSRNYRFLLLLFMFSNDEIHSKNIWVFVKMAKAGI